MVTKSEHRNSAGAGGAHGTAHLAAAGIQAARPDRACCCAARPMMVVLMPPSATRPRPVDLWLCGHHYRQSRKALAAAGARVCDAPGYGK
jgi:hypothetical protein